VPPATDLVVVQSRSRSQAKVQRDERNLRFPPRTWTWPAQPTIAVAFKSRRRPRSVSGDSGVGDETSALPLMDSQRQYFIRTPGIGVGHQRPACASDADVRTSSKPVTAPIRWFVLIGSSLKRPALVPLSWDYSDHNRGLRNKREVLRCCAVAEASQSPLTAQKRTSSAPASMSAKCQ
jgi:hypothetical protein